LGFFVPPDVCLVLIDAVLVLIQFTFMIIKLFFVLSYVSLAETDEGLVLLVLRVVPNLHFFKL